MLRASHRSFWSPLTNRREDAYGGTLDNRLRFGGEILAAIRARVGPDFLVGLRMVADEDAPGGITCEEGIEIARRMVATGHVDFLKIIRGMVDSDNHLADVLPLQGHARAPASRPRRRGACGDEVPGLPRGAHQ